MTLVTRFAPSPTGYLHLGHAYAAFFAEEAARQKNGQFLLRIEDIDQSRVHPKFEQAIYEDLKWLGLQWTLPVRRQSEHMDAYAEALNTLTSLDVLYPCFCTRKEIKREIESMGYAPHMTPPSGFLYPGTCRSLSLKQQHAKQKQGIPFALRLNMDKAFPLAIRHNGGLPLYWNDVHHGKQQVRRKGLHDIVIARKDIPASYHLAVVVDDYQQAVTLVTRGNDLLEATHIHRLLQALLKIPSPWYHHHALLTDSAGKRLAKRDQSLTLHSLRAEGKTPQQIRTQIEHMLFQAQKSCHFPERT